jgi:hypothetical protein
VVENEVMATSRKYRVDGSKRIVEITKYRKSGDIRLFE